MHNPAIGQPGQVRNMAQIATVPLLNRPIIGSPAWLRLPFIGLHRSSATSSILCLFAGLYSGFQVACQLRVKLFQRRKILFGIRLPVHFRI